MRSREAMESKAARSWIVNRFGVDESEEVVYSTKPTDGDVQKPRNERIYEFTRGKETVLYEASERVKNMNA